MPVLPLVGSISTFSPGAIRPAFSASRIMLTPMRSLTLLQGFWLSSLASTVALQPWVTLFSFTRGVQPISSVTSFAIFMILVLSNTGLFYFEFIKIQRLGVKKQNFQPAETAPAPGGRNRRIRCAASGTGPGTGDSTPRNCPPGSGGASAPP